MVYNQQLWFLFVLLINAIICQVFAGYLKDQIVVKLGTVNSNCVRYLNGTGTIGCQSNQNGNIGVLSHIQQPADIQASVDKLPFGIANLIALVNISELTSALIDALRLNERVQGIILFDHGKRPLKFSEDSVCPNQQFSFYKTNECHQWNAKGAIHPEGLRFLAFDKPIRYSSNATEIDLLLNKCAKSFNSKLEADGFRCVGRMTSFMLAAGTAELCESRQEAGIGFGGPHPRLCDPLKERNLFAMLPALSQKDTGIKTDQFVLAARMDTFSTIYNSRGGHFSVLTSIIPMLSVAQAIGSRMDFFLPNAKTRQLLLAFFNGESMGYIGSSRWLWDINKKAFPHPKSKLPEGNVRQIELDGLSFFLELQQIGTVEQLYLHTDKSVYAANRTLVKQMVNAAENVPGANVQFIDPNKLPYDDTFPPASYHSVLKATQHVPGLLLSSFVEEYDYSLLNSMFDQQSLDSASFNKLVQMMVKAAQVALQTALNYVFEEDKSKIDQFKISPDYTKTLANCFFQKPVWNCELFMGVMNATHDKKIGDWLRDTANNLFIGTDPRYPDTSFRRLLHALLVHSLGQKDPAMNVKIGQQCRDHNKKQNVYTYVWQNDPVTNEGACYKTSIYSGEAKSPAFEIGVGDFTSGNFSTWMESQWQSTGMEIYLKADYQLELYAFLTAIFIVLVSAPLYYGLNEQWFLDSSLPPASPQPL